MKIERARLCDTPALAWTAAQVFAVRIVQARSSAPCPRPWPVPDAPVLPVSCWLAGAGCGTGNGKRSSPSSAKDSRAPGGCPHRSGAAPLWLLDWWCGSPRPTRGMEDSGGAPEGRRGEYWPLFFYCSCCCWCRPLSPMPLSRRWGRWTPGSFRAERGCPVAVEESTARAGGVQGLLALYPQTREGPCFRQGSHRPGASGPVHRPAPPCAALRRPAPGRAAPATKPSTPTAASAGW